MAQSSLGMVHLEYKILPVNNFFFLKQRIDRDSPTSTFNGSQISSESQCISCWQRKLRQKPFDGESDDLVYNFNQVISHALG